MTNEGKGAVIITLWSIAFHAGMFIAAGINRPIGFMLMVTATLIMLIYLNSERKLESEVKRRKKYEQDCEWRIEEAMRNDKN